MLKQKLIFRIIFVPHKRLDSHEKDELLLQVNSILEKCDLEDFSTHYSQIKKAEDENYSEIEELALEVSGDICKDIYADSVYIYQKFCLKWKKYSYYLCPSYIELYKNDSFVNSSSMNGPHLRLKYDSIRFGILPHNGRFYQFHKLKNKKFAENGINFFHDTRSVLIEYETFQMSFTYENIRKIFVNIGNSPSQIYFDLLNPPIIFRINWENKYEEKCRNLNLESPNEECLFPHPPLISTDVLGRANVLCVTFKDPSELPKILSGIHRQCNEKPVYYSCLSVEPRPIPDDPCLEETMDFDCIWLITAIFFRSFILISQTSHVYSRLNKLHSLSKENPKFLVMALVDVLLALDLGKILNFWIAIESQYNYYASNKNEINFKENILPSTCTMIRSVILTPTRMLLWPKDVVFSNRVLRHFDADYSIRVSFREDNMTKFSFYPDINVMDSCIKERVLRGIFVGPRKYEFLAWSNSQLRDHGFWMYAEDEKGCTAKKIRKWMGNFSHIHNIPKFMARMGQCFSQTEDSLSIPLKPHLVRTVEDIEGGWDHVNGKPYCFSDGIGKISEKLAKQVCKALGLNTLCSAYQIRYGGYKGVLVVDPTLKDVEIVFRKSMKKFSSPNCTKLEIAKTSGPMPLFLNRFVITLLNDLGVQHETFLQLQEGMLKKLTDMLYEEDEASKFLQSNVPIDLLTFDDLSKSGIHLTTEPFFKSVLLALHRRHIEKIKSKARIAIDPSKGRNMFGVLDETNTLNYGEVFVQYSRDISSRKTSRDTLILRGEVLVTKNPCMHPGDIRKLKAVDVPSLHHIVDCIVFPQRGHRPHPNEMGGSDLDGDEYFVLWDPRLIFHRNNVKPSDFPAVNSPDVPRIRVSDMITFFQDYIINDQVGRIANAYLAHACKYGIFSPICRTIANKFSVAVDFAKNGAAVYLAPDEKPKEYPDFMENINRPMFKCERVVLGKMFRVCKDFEYVSEEISTKYENVKVDPDLKYSGWEKYRDNAIFARDKYNAYFRSILRNYDIQHEAEAISGAFHKLHCRFQERKDRNEIEKMIIDCIKKLFKSMRDEFMEEFNCSGKADTVCDSMLQKASAWYIVTYSDPNSKFLSFPWIVSDFLYKIKSKRTLCNPLHFSPIILNLDTKIIQYEKKNLLPRLGKMKIKRLYKHYEIFCDEDILGRALSILFLWAEDSGIPDYNYFIKLFCHVCENLGYIRRHDNPDNDDSISLFCLQAPKTFTTLLGGLINWIVNDKDKNKYYSAAQLCLEFLKFCSTFRFYSYKEMKNILPFDVYNYDQLAECAIFSYHKFAVSGEFYVLNFDKTINNELIVMNPEFINSSVFSEYYPISEKLLRKARNILIKHSKVAELTLREILQTEKVCVSATGSGESLKRLKDILRKEDSTLRNLFRTGKMPVPVSNEINHMLKSFPEDDDDDEEIEEEEDDEEEEDKEEEEEEDDDDENYGDNRDSTCLVN